MSRRVLTQQLQELEEDEIVLRVGFAEVPPRAKYCLMPYGPTLRPVLDVLMAWGRRHLERRKQLATSLSETC